MEMRPYAKEIKKTLKRLDKKIIITPSNSETILAEGLKKRKVQKTFRINRYTTNLYLHHRHSYKCSLLCTLQLIPV